MADGSGAWPYRLSWTLAVLASIQAVLGLVMSEQYRDVEWIKLTWFGNDWVTLLVGVPLMVAALMLARRGSVRGTLLWLGLLAYFLYNYAYYLLGAAMNVFFALYVALFVLSAATLILALVSVDQASVARSFGPSTPARTLGGYLVFVATGLSAVWMGVWAAHVFAGKPTPIAVEAFKLVAALDMTIMVPALLAGGVLLWKRSTWGFALAAMASIQGALYLLVLTVNTLFSFQRGLTKPPGELPIWGSLALFTSVAAILLLLNARSPRSTTA